MTEEPICQAFFSTGRPKMVVTCSVFWISASICGYTSEAPTTMAITRLQRKAFAQVIARKMGIK